MKILFQKELAALRPFALALLAFNALGLGVMLCIEFPDQLGLDPVNWLKEDRGTMAFFVVFFGVIMGAGLLTNESDQGTLGFLDSLPVSRSRIFLAKVTAGLLVLALVPFIDMGANVVLGGMSRQSTDGPFPWSFVLAQIFLQSVASFSVLGVALALSFFRKWFALVCGLWICGFFLLRARGAASLELIDPHALLLTGIKNGGLQLPWNHVQAHLVLGSVGMALAWAGFCTMGDRSTLAFQRLGASRWKKALMFLGWLAVAAMGIALLMNLAPSTAEQAAMRLAKRPAEEAVFARETSSHYEFLFREGQRADAAELLGAAEEIHTKVVALLGVAPMQSAIVVDLASPITRHAAGLSFWKKIRMPIHPGQSLEERRRILGHETTHIYIDHLSENALMSVFNSGRFFHEGLASYIEETGFSSDEQKARSRRWAAAAHARGKVPFEMLADDRALSAKRDKNIVYPLGAIFIQALVATSGNEAPAKVLRALARPGAPSGLKGSALWRNAMQAAGLSLERVTAAYEARLEALQVEEAEFIARLPRLSAVVETQGEEVLIRSKHEGDAPGELLCLVAVSRGAGDDTLELSADADGVFRMPREQNPGIKLRYQLGWRCEDTSAPVFEPWAEHSF